MIASRTRSRSISTTPRAPDPSTNNHADSIVSAPHPRLSRRTPCFNVPHFSELERQANIARNKALLEKLELGDAVNNIGFAKKSPPPPKAKSKAKPVQPAKRVKREVVEDTGPRRQSARLKRSADDPNESPEKKRARLVRTLHNPVTAVLFLTLGTILVASGGGGTPEG